MKNNPEALTRGMIVTHTEEAVRESPYYINQNEVNRLFQQVKLPDASDIEIVGKMMWDTNNSPTIYAGKWSYPLNVLPSSEINIANNEDCKLYSVLNRSAVKRLIEISDIEKATHKARYRNRFLQNHIERRVTGYKARMIGLISVGGFACAEGAENLIGTKAGAVPFIWASLRMIKHGAKEKRSNVEKQYEDYFDYMGRHYNVIGLEGTPDRRVI